MCNMVYGRDSALWPEKKGADNMVNSEAPRWHADGVCQSEGVCPGEDNKNNRMGVGGGGGGIDTL